MHSQHQQPKPTHLRQVFVSSSVYHACLVHALSTEREEVMGLLLGQTTIDGDAHVWHSIIIPRLDKRPDRVEISMERLAAAPEEALRVSQQLGMHTRVCGWYHSHPHITPYPSHVDLRTQASYQLMDPVWVGLIFSVFDASSRAGQQTGRVALHCFQSIVSSHGGGACQHRKVPVQVVPDEFLLLPQKAPKSSAAFVAPAQTILTESKEIKKKVADEEHDLIDKNAAVADSKSNNSNDNGKSCSSSSSSSSVPHTSFDRTLYDEACRNLIETQTFTVCQKMLRPMASGEVFENMEQRQRHEMRRNEEILNKLREEVKALDEQATMQILQ